MVKVKGPENLCNFNPSRLVERKDSCRFLTAMKWQILIGLCLMMSERSDVMKKARQKYDNKKI